MIPFASRICFREAADEIRTSSANMKLDETMNIISMFGKIKWTT